MVASTDLVFGATPDQPDDGPGWIWTVYPSHSSDPMVAIGHSGTRAKARAQTEGQMLTRVNAAFGLIIGPRGEQEVCRRTGDGGFRWLPFGEPVG